MSPDPTRSGRELVRDAQRENHRYHGWGGRIYTDEFDGFHRGSPSFTEDETGTAATIVVEWPRADVQTRETEGGFDLDVDAVIQIDPSENDGAVGEALSDGRGETERASIIEDERNGKRYRVKRIRNENVGLRYVDVDEITRSEEPT